MMEINKYGQYCPIARAAEILGDRWTLLIIRDLLYGAQHFNELERGLPGISRALLAARLRRLQDIGVLVRHPAPRGEKVRYELTEAGRELQSVVNAFTVWGAAWCFGEPLPDELDPILLLWWIRDGVAREHLPKERIVIEFQFQDTRPSPCWLVLTQEDVSLCVKHPGFGIDVLVSTDAAVLYQVWMGRLTWSEASNEGQLVIDSTPALIRDFPLWFTLSPLAGAVRDRMQRGRANSSGRF